MLKNKKSRRLMIKSFIITVIACFVVAGGGFIGWRSVVRPPSLPSAGDIMPQLPNPSISPEISDDDPAFYVVEPHPDDALLNIDSYFDLTTEGGWERTPNFITFLIFGYDDGLNTDTIMVAAYNADTRQAYIISIPRDTQVDVQRNIRKINSAYPAGRLHGRGHEGGVDQLRREVSTLIGFMPDFYIGVEEDAFVHIVDAVGGVYIDVPFHMHYRDPFQDLYINIPAGRQRLDGENALNFVRYRYGYGRRTSISNHQRMQHQHQFIEAMMQELLTPRVITQIPQLIRTYRDHVSTDIPLRSQLWLGEQFVLGGVTLHAYNYPVTSARTIRWYDFPVGYDEVLELINRTVNPFTQDITSEMLRLMSP